MTKAVEVGFTVWAISLGVFAAVGVVYAAVQVALGNIQHIVI
jgi:hypothetical protein